MNDVLAAIAPLVLLLPLVELTSLWISISMKWLSLDAMKSLGPVVAKSVIHLFFDLPNFAVSIVAGLAFGIASRERALRLAWVFGMGMCISQTLPVFLTKEAGWPLYLFNLAHVALPVATAAAILRLLPVKPPGACQKCGYDLRGLTEPRCPECSMEFDALATGQLPG